MNIRFLLFGLLIFSSVTTHAQEKFKEFYASLDAVFNRQEYSFAGDCKTKLFSMKIEADKKGSILDISLSDRSDTLVSVAFKKNLQKLNTKELSAFVVKNKSGKTTFILSICFIVEGGGCTNPSVNINNIPYQMRFNNKDLVGKVILMEPYGFTYTIAH